MRILWSVLLLVMCASCLQTPPGVEAPNRAPALLEQDPDPTCAPIRCPAPPSGCKYGAPDVVNGCAVSCGPISCSPEGGDGGGGGGFCGTPPVCQPKKDCSFPSPVYQNGCLIACGIEKCDPDSVPLDDCGLAPPKCGQKPPVSCEWSLIKDAKGCTIDCEPVRENSLFDAGTCDQSVRCELQRDANGCAVACGTCPTK